MTRRLREPLPVRAVSLLSAVVLLASACSGGAADEPASTTLPLGEADAALSVVDGTTPPTSDAAAAAGEARSADDPAGRAAGEPVEVSISVSAPDLGIEADLVAESSVDADLFGDFVACSGTRAELGTYAVTVARSSGDPLAVALLSAARVTGAGVVDADVRIERSGRDPVVAAGTMTLDAGLQSGTFVAFDADGARVEGSFECDASIAPQPLAEQVGGSVEVVALLRQDGAERIVALATSNPALASCPGDVAGQPLVVRADGGAELGSLTTFELTVDGVAGDDAALRMRVGERVEVFDDVTVVLDDDRSAGTFAGDAGDLAVDGAFTCK